MAAAVFAGMAMAMAMLLLFLGSASAGPNMVNKFVAAHNAARAAVGVPPLAWDARLARYAEAYAAQRRRDCALAHSDGPYGENLFWGSGSGWTPEAAVASWVGERWWYRRGMNACAAGKDCGHYTQVVWRDTRLLGCAVVKCEEGRGVFITCNYDPPGNYVGERPY